MKQEFFFKPCTTRRKLKQVGMTEFPMLLIGALILILECVFCSCQPRLFHSALPLLLLSICLFTVHCDCAPLELVPCEEEWS